LNVKPLQIFTVQGWRPRQPLLFWLGEDANLGQQVKSPTKKHALERVS